MCVFVCCSLFSPFSHSHSPSPFSPPPPPPFLDCIRRDNGPFPNQSSAWLCRLAAPQLQHLPLSPSPTSFSASPLALTAFVPGLTPVCEFISAPSSSSSSLCAACKISLCDDVPRSTLHSEARAAFFFGTKLIKKMYTIFMITFLVLFETLKLNILRQSQ